MIDKIKALMLLTKTKQIDIAKKLGTTQANISRIINKDTDMSIKELNDIVAASNGRLEIVIILPDGTRI